MKFIREMIARKAAGEEEAKRDFGFEGLNITKNGVRADPTGPKLVVTDEEEQPEVQPAEHAGFEDELDVDEGDLTGIEASDDAASDEAVMDEDYDEDAELDALDAAYPDVEPDEPGEDTELAMADDSEDVVVDEELFSDIPDAKVDEPMPKLTAADIERAMKLRKKIWQKLPDEDDDPFALLGDEDEDADPITRPLTLPLSHRVSRPVSVPVDIEEAYEDVDDLAAESATAGEPAEVVMDEIEDDVDAQWPQTEDDEAEVAEDEAGEVVAEDAVARNDAAEDDSEEGVAADAETEAEVLWPKQPEPQAAVRAEPDQAETAEPEPEPAVDDSTEIQALLARAALEAASRPAPRAEAPVAAGDTNPGGRRAGRVKTRLLGFQSEETQKNIFETAARAEASEPDLFPVGWMVVISGPGRGASFSLHNGVSLIGRGEDQAVRLDFGDNSISRNNHASVAFDDEGNKFFLGHGGKSNIVRLNQKPVLSTEELSDGDVIRIGETTLRFAAFCGGDFNWADEDKKDDADHAAIA